MLSYRNIDLPADRDTILEFHCLGSFEGESPWVRPTPYAAYKSGWLSTELPDLFMQELTESMEDSRTILEMWEENGRPAGFLWVAFLEVYDVTVAHIYEAEVSLEHQRQGIGTLMLQHAEDLAREQGARLLRSNVSVENSSAQGVHVNLGYTVHRVLYEKLLEDEG